jgi:hypothetical protein
MLTFGLLLFVATAWSSRVPNVRQLFWPDQFKMDFVTPSNTTYASWGTLFFSKTLRATRIDHSAGAYECVHFYNTTSACTLFMTSAGLQRTLSSTGDCCVDNPTIHSTDGRWMVNTTFGGDAVIAGRVCHAWLGEHTYYSDAIDNRPCGFTYPPAPQQNMQFLFHTFNKSVQLTSEFMIPSNCNKLCQSPKPVA